MELPATINNKIMITTIFIIDLKVRIYRCEN